jgi:hypothetical protein
MRGPNNGRVSIADGTCTSPVTAPTDAPESQFANLIDWEPEEEQPTKRRQLRAARATNRQVRLMALLI